MQADDASSWKGYEGSTVTEARIFLCFGNEASRDRYVGRSVGLSVGLLVCRSVSTQLSKKFK